VSDSGDKPGSKAPPAPPPKKGSAWRLIEDAVAEHEAEQEAERVAGMDDEELAAELKKAGVDEAKLRGLTEKAIAAADAAERAEAKAPAPQPTKVVSLDAARERKRSGPPWWTLAAAAAVLVTGTFVAMNQGDNGVSNPYPGDDAGPSANEEAARYRATAFDQCASKHFDLCQEALDRARQLDPSGEEEPRVKDARAAIARAIADKPQNGGAPSSSAPAPSTH